MTKELDSNEVQLFEGNVKIRLEYIKKRIDQYFEDLERSAVKDSSHSISDPSKNS